MLHGEYEDKKVTIVGLDVATANMRLKEQALKYIKETYTFNCDLGGGEMATQWWKQLDGCCTNDAQPMAVHTH